jgi:hypothetical protein
MRTLLAAVAAAAAMLAAVPGASADPMRYGVADDWSKWHPCGDVWWQAAKDIGYQDLRLTVQWDETQPAIIPFQANLQAAVTCAVLADLRPILSIYPVHPGAIGSNPDAQAQFAAFVGLVGTAFPDVTNFVVGNEPNVNRFWQPQYVAGADAAATDYEHTLAASYDALKAVRPDATVWGPAISSRGNDDPRAASNPSHSPVWFIKDLGDAYRASGRTAPIFDEFDMHPYPPVQDTAPFSQPFQWPQVGAANLDRVKQALWDAFHGTAQPIPAEYGGGRTAAAGLPIDFDEVGEQTTVTGHAAVYTDAPENVIPISEAEQAARYVELAQIGACDPDVKSILWFPLIDDTGLSSGFQSGQLYADLTPKLSYQAMKDEIASAQGRCLGGAPALSRRWVHTTAVIGAAGSFAGPGTPPGSQPRNKPAGLKQLRFSLTAAEDATYTASLVPVGPAGRQASGVRAVATVSGTLQAYRRPPIALLGPVRPGRYRIRVVIAAATNADRISTITSRAFTVGGRSTRRP